jgi:hypothetical protein
LADFDPVRSLREGIVMRASRFMPGCGAALLGITPDGTYGDLALPFTLDQNTLCLAHSTAAWNTTRHKDDVDNTEWKILHERVSLDK